MDDQEPDFLEDTEVKPKKQLSEQKASTSSKNTN